MIAHLVLAGLIATSAPGPETAAPERSRVTESIVTVVGIGPKPDFGSGIVTSTVLVLGQSADGDIDPYYLIHLHPDMPVPTMGAQCTFWHSEHTLEFVGGLEILQGVKGRIFSKFECSPLLDESRP